MKKILLPLLVLALFVIACNRTPTVNPSRADMLRTGKWKMSAATVTLHLPMYGRDTTVSYYSFIPACRLDDYLKFDSLNRGAVHNGGTSCSLADVDSIGFIWGLSNDDNTLNIYNGFTMIDSFALSPNGYFIDTINNTPGNIILDTLATTPIVVLDSILRLQLGIVNSPAINIYNASLTSFSQSAFTMNFNLVAHYPQLTWFSQTVPVILPDTFRYSVTYTNF